MGATRTSNWSSMRAEIMRAVFILCLCNIIFSCCQMKSGVNWELELVALSLSIKLNATNSSSQ